MEKFSALQNVRAGSRIGVGVDTHRHLHVLLDGEDLGVAAADTPLTHPCYALFDLGWWLKKVCICMTCRTGLRAAKRLCICMTCRTARRTAEKICICLTCRTILCTAEKGMHMYNMHVKQVGVQLKKYAYVCHVAQV